MSHPTGTCRCCGTPIGEAHWASAVMRAVWSDSRRQYERHGPYHHICAQRLDAEQQTGTPFTVDPSEIPGFYLFKPRYGHGLGSVRLVQIEMRDSADYGPDFQVPIDVETEEEPGKGYWTGPVRLPKGFDAKDTDELFSRKKP